MNPELPQNSREELEARLTAYLLGELPAHEAAALRQALDNDPDLARLCDQFKPAIQLVREAAVPAQSTATQAEEPLRLSDERRQKLLAHFKTVKPAEFANPEQKTSTWLFAIAACAVVTMILAGSLLPALSKAKQKSLSVSVRSNLKQVEIAKELWAEDKQKSAEDAPTFKDLAPYMGGDGSGSPKSIAGETYVLGKMGEPPSAEVSADKAKTVFGYGLSGKGTGVVSMDGRGQLAFVTPGKLRADMFDIAPLPKVDKSPDELSSIERPQTLTPLAGNRSKIALPPTEEFASTPASTLGTDRSESGVTPSLSPSQPLAQPAPVASQNASRFALQTATPLSVAPPLEAGEIAQTYGGPVGNGVATGLPPAQTLNYANDGKIAVDDSSVSDGIITSGVRGTTKSISTVNSFGGMSKSDGFNAGIIVAPQTASEPPRMIARSTVLIQGAAPKGSFDFGVGNNVQPGQQVNPRALNSNVPLLGDVSVVGGLFTGGQKLSSALTNSLSTGNYELAGQPGDATFSYDPANKTRIAMGDSIGIQNTFDDKELPPAGAIGGSRLALSEAEKTKEPSVFYRIRPAAQSEDLSDNANRKLAQKTDLDSAYKAKEQELVMLNKQRDALEDEKVKQGINEKMPKNPMTRIVDLAEPNKAAPESFGKKLSEALTGKVERTARIRTQKDTADVQGVAGQREMSGIYDPYFIQTEVEAIQSEAVIDGVIDKLDLKKAWADKNGKPLTQSDARAILKRNLDVRGERNTDLVDIGYKGKTPEEAAKVANAVADSYSTFRKSQYQQSTTAADAAKAQTGLAATDLEVKRKTEELAVLQRRAEVNPVANAPTQNDIDKLDISAAKPAAPIPTPQPEMLTRENAFSTFSLNVADVSFKLAAATLEKGQMPDPASVRSEEFLNAFDYRDPDPAPGAPVGFAWERAHDPFAQNRDLLRFSVKTAAAGRAPGRALNIVLLLDNSGSMERADRVQIIHEALRVLAAQLQPQDIISVVTFARTPRLWVDGVSGSKAGEVIEKVSGLTPQGGTNLEEAIKLAYETALRHYLANGINRVVLLTDGAANLGNVDPVALKQKVEDNRRQGIALDCFGIGWEGYNDDLLETLSRNGNGRYGFLNTPEEAANDFAGQLAGALNIAAADVKVQVEFNLQRVSAYRQIGYAKYQLTKEQFRDNTVDAAEIGAAESGNALYVIDVNAAGEGPLATVRVRFKVPGTSDYQEHAWEVPYNGNALSLEQSSPAMRLAATASAFAEWLATSPYAIEVTPDQLLRYVAGVPQIYGADTRPAKLEWMIRQEKSISGK